MPEVAEGELWDSGDGKTYRMEKVVGNGAFGIVWRARDVSGGTESSECVAIKKVVLDRRYHNRELEMMKGLDHKFVIKLHNSFEKPGRKRDETYLHLVMDFLPDTIRSVALAFQKDRTRFPIEHVRVYLYQTLKALEYVHEKRICHRDLKPDNLLVDQSTLKLKLIDFGCAKVLVKGQPNVSYICSRYYRAPELMFGATEYTCAVDMWSIGTIMVELLLGHLPFQGQDSTQQHLVEIMKLLGTPSEKELRAMRATCSVDELPKLKAYPWDRVFPAGTPTRATDLARKLLTYDPSQRLTATQALTHPFLEGIEALVEHGGARSAGDGLTSEHLKEWTVVVDKAFKDAMHVNSSSLTQTVSACNSLDAGARAEMLGPKLREMDSAMVEEVKARVLAVGLHGHGGGGGNGAEASGVAALRETLRQLQHAVGGASPAKVRETAREAKEETGRMRAELESVQQEAAAAEARAKEEGASPGDDNKPASAGRRANRTSNSEFSPGMARSSLVDGSNAESRRAKQSEGTGLNGMIGDGDELGQATPMGARPRDGSGATG